MPHIDTVPQAAYWFLVGLSIGLGVATWRVAKWQGSSRATRKHTTVTFIVGGIITVAVGFYGLVVATSDNYHDVKSGRVIGSDYDPAHYTYGQSCSGSGSSRSCHQTSTWHDDDWSLKLRDENTGYVGTIHFHDSDPRPANPTGSYYGGQ